MLQTLKRLFTELVDRQTATIFADDDPRLAVAALMCHVVAADGVVRPAERQRMMEELARRYGLGAEDARGLAEAARRAESETATVQRFTAGLQRSLPLAERREIVASLWKLVFADGHALEFEDAVVGRIAELLGIEAHERIALRKTVEADCEEEAMRAAEGLREDAKTTP